MKIYSHIASLFDYPRQSMLEDYLALSTYFNDKGEDNPSGLKEAEKHFTQLSVAELQEYYIATFDVKAACFLDIGYVLFGEDTRRGQFLIHMNKEQEVAGNTCGTEFADHLPNVLRLLSLTPVEAFREELVVSILIPALHLMVDNFAAEGNVYKVLLNTLLSLLGKEYPLSSYEPFEKKDPVTLHARGGSCHSLQDTAHVLSSVTLNVKTP